MRLHQFADDSLEFFEDIGVTIGTAFARKRDQANLEKSEKKYKNLFQSSFDGIAESNLDGVLMSCNSAYAKMAGYKPEELKELKYQDLTPLKWAEVDKKHVKQALDKGFSDIYEKERIHKDGTIFPISMRIWLRKNERGEPISLWGIIRDISKRKQAEQQLKEKTIYLDSILSSATEYAIATTDIDFRITYYNPLAEKFFGYTAEQVLGKTVQEMHTLEKVDQKRFEKAIELVQTQGEYCYQVTWKNKNATRHLESRISGIYSFEHNLVGFALFSTDITEKLKAEKALLQSEKKYRSILESMKDATYICSPDFHIEYMNPRMISRIGYDATGELCYKAIYNSDEKCSWCVFDQIKQGEHIDYELANPTDNRFYSIANSPIHHSTENISKLTIFRDITENKAMEEQLRQARKMESIGILAGGVAHDFNNLLYMIIGNTELALEDIPEWNPVHESLEEIKSASLRASGVVKQLLNFSRKTDQNLKPIGVVTVIKDALKFLRSTIPSTVELILNLPNADIPIQGDPVQINQVMMNLCINASQVMQETGGTIKIDVGTESLDEEDCQDLANFSAGTYIKITIADSGPGIAPDISDKIFDPYFTTKEFGAGSGMGLAVVHGIVKNHNGAIYVDSNSGQGASFNILLPVIDELPEPETKIKEDFLHGSEAILFVDDEESIANMTGKTLERLGYQIEKHLNPVEALELFKAKPDVFDLVITDMTMPQMTGINLTDKIKEIRPDIPVIICTGHSAVIDKEKARQLGIDGFVMKPVSKLKIAKAIREVLEK